MRSKKSWRDDFDYSVYLDGNIVYVLDKFVATDRKLSYETLTKIKGLHYTKAKIESLMCETQDVDRLRELGHYVERCDHALEQAWWSPY